MTQEQPTRRIAGLRIDNVLAIESAEIKVGDGLVIYGRNGTGKTAILHAIQAVLDENVRSKMVRTGEDEGQAMLVLTDGTTAFRKISDEKAERPVLVAPNGKRVTSPATKLAAMAPGLLLNPVSFLELDEAQKAKILADVFPVELSHTELEQICSGDVDLREVEQDGNGLARANQAYKAAYKARHAANGELDQAVSARDTERQKIPKGFDAEAARGLSSEAIAGELGKIEHHNRLLSDGVKQMTQLEGEEKSLNVGIEALERELTEKKAQLDVVKTRLMNGRAWLETHEHIDPVPTQAKLHSLDQQRLFLHCFDAAEAYDAKCKEISSRAKRLDAIVATLHALPGELVRRAKIPIEGLTIENGVVHVDGRPLDNLSEGQQYRVAVRVAVAGVKDLKLVCIDGAEKIAATLRNQLIDDLREEGIQVFMTVTDECDFNICDLDGKPADARVVITPSAALDQPSTRGPLASSLSPAKTLVAPKALTTKQRELPTSVIAQLPMPAPKPKASLFDSAQEDEALFGVGEPSI